MVHLLLSTLLTALTILQSVSASAFVDSPRLQSTKSESGVTTTYRYDESDRLVAIERPAGNVIARYGYDPFGGRSGFENSLVTRFVAGLVGKDAGLKCAEVYPLRYSEHIFDRRRSPIGPRRIAVEDIFESTSGLWKENGAGARTYFDYTDDGLAAEFSSAGTVQKSYLFAPESYWSTAPLALKQGGTYHYYHNDHLGTPRKLTNNVGGVTWSARYSAYGVADVTASGADNPLRFPGQYSDPESGLYYNYQRNYDPELGVYAEQDPYGVAWTGPNRHLYANGEPGLGFDPTGEIVPAWVIWSGVTFLASEAYSGFPTFRCFQYLSDDCLYAQNAEFCIDAAIGAATGIGVGVAVRGVKLLKPRVSLYDEITKGNSVRNVRTNVSLDDFARNLIDEGFEGVPTKTPGVTRYILGDRRYTLRPFSRSEGPTAEYFVGDGRKLKIRLKR